MLDACTRAIGCLPDGLVKAIDGKRILASGCTGFFGIWTVAAVSALRAAGVDVALSIASVNPARFRQYYPGWSELADITWLPSPISGLDPRAIASLDFGLHMAASSDAVTNAADPRGMITAMISNTAAMVELCSKRSAALLMVSSGAVYGRRTAQHGPPIEAEDRFSAPPCLDTAQAYGQAKRLAETVVACERSLEWTVARPFAFMGPYLPLHSHFAAGNFLRDAAAGRAIEIKGDGLPLRSLMHPADCIAWQLWLMACGPRGTACNVGSDAALSLGQLACEIADAAGSPTPSISKPPGAEIESYVPNIDKARALGLRFAFDRTASIRQSLDWLARNGGEWSAQSTYLAARAFGATVDPIKATP